MNAKKPRHKWSAPTLLTDTQECSNCGLLRKPDPGTSMHLFCFPAGFDWLGHERSIRPGWNAFISTVRPPCVAKESP